ncbi:MAG: hypothetical protein JHC88_14580 [Niveispirillum sp.]|nr:hypothetical protein [Niveispirillum sp.]
MWIKRSIAITVGAFLSLTPNSFAEADVQKIPIEVEIKRETSKEISAAFKFKNNHKMAICIASRYWSRDAKNFDVFNKDKFAVNYRGVIREYDGPPREYVVIPPGFTEVLYFNLSKYYELESVGHYHFSLTLFAPFCSSFDMGVADEPSPRTLAREPSLEAQLALLRQRGIQNGVLLVSGQIYFEVIPQ